MGERGNLIRARSMTRNKAEWSEEKSGKYREVNRTTWRLRSTDRNIMKLEMKVTQRIKRQEYDSGER